MAVPDTLTSPVPVFNEEHTLASVIERLKTVALAGTWLHRAQDPSVFRVKPLEHKYVELGRWASGQLPRQAVVLAAQPAGSIRYYSLRPTLSWDAIEPEWLGPVLDECRARGLTPYLAIESWEREPFRSRSRGQSGLADLDARDLGSRQLTRRRSRR